MPATVFVIPDTIKCKEEFPLNDEIKLGEQFIIDKSLNIKHGDIVLFESCYTNHPLIDYKDSKYDAYKIRYNEFYELISIDENDRNTGLMFWNTDHLQELSEEANNTYGGLPNDFKLFEEPDYFTDDHWNFLYRYCNWVNVVDEMIDNITVFEEMVYTYFEDCRGNDHVIIFENDDDGNVENIKEKVLNTLEKEYILKTTREYYEKEKYFPDPSIILHVEI